MLSEDNCLQLATGALFSLLAVAIAVRAWQLYVSYRSRGSADAGSNLSVGVFVAAFVYSLARSVTEFLDASNALTSASSDSPRSGVIATFLNAVPDLFKTVLQLLFLIKWVRMMEHLAQVSLANHEDWCAWGWRAVYGNALLLVLRTVAIGVSVVDYCTGLIGLSARTWEATLLYSIAVVYAVSGGSFLWLGWMVQRMWSCATFSLEEDRRRAVTIAALLGGFSVFLAACVVLETALGNRGRGLRWLVLSTWVMECAVVFLVLWMLLRPRPWTSESSGKANISNFTAGTSATLLQNHNNNPEPLSEEARLNSSFTGKAYTSGRPVSHPSLARIVPT